MKTIKNFKQFNENKSNSVNRIETIDTLKSIAKKLKEYSNEAEYPNFIYYGKSKNEILFNYNKKDKTLWVSYQKIWGKLENRGFTNDRISKLLQKYIADFLKIKVKNFKYIDQQYQGGPLLK